MCIMPELMCITGSITKGSPSSRRPEYQFPTWIRDMWRSKQLRQKQREIGEIIAPIVHTSWRTAYREYIQILNALLEDSKTRQKVIEELQLTEDTVDFILKA